MGITTQTGTEDDRRLRLKICLFANDIDTVFQLLIHNLPPLISSGQLFQPRRSQGSRRHIYLKVIRDGRSDIRKSIAFFSSEEHTSELQSRFDLVCCLLLEKKKQ